jgi:hypothetical protein
MPKDALHDDRALRPVSSLLLPVALALGPAGLAVSVLVPRRHGAARATGDGRRRSMTRPSRAHRSD